MKRCLIATRNSGKAREFADLFGSGWEVLTLKDINYLSDIDETGDTFEANAKIKALAVSSVFDGLVIADDSGLEVDALNGAPGVYSARYAGEPKDDCRNNLKLLEELKNVAPENRGAQFRCVLAAAKGTDVVAVCEGVCRGKIIDAPRGSDGFGYDPLFVPDGSDKTFSEMPLDMKHKFSHRAKAMDALVSNKNSTCHFLMDFGLAGL